MLTKRMLTSVLLLATIALTPTVAEAKSFGCYGSNCIGVNPSKHCNNDQTKTVASYALRTSDGYAGNIDLRYSPTCHANWGRFTPAAGWREALRSGLKLYIPSYGRVTAWNPKQPSQGTVDAPISYLPGFSTWTYAVDGTKLACVGVEVIYSKPSDPSAPSISKGWFWGPCG